MVESQHQAFQLPQVQPRNQQPSYGGHQASGSLDTGFCARVCIMIFCLVLALWSLAYFIMSTVMLNSYIRLDFGDKIVVHTFSILLNVYIIIYCFFGCVSLCLKNPKFVRCFLTFTFVNLAIMFVFVLAIDIPLAMGTTKESLEENFNRIVSEYKLNPSNNSETESKRALDEAQRLFGCCGALGPEDFKFTPPSCGNETKGCATVLHGWEVVIRASLTVDTALWLVFLLVAFFGYLIGKSSVQAGDVRSVGRS